MADTPTPTAQDWERLGATWCVPCNGWEWTDSADGGRVLGSVTNPDADCWWYIYLREMDPDDYSFRWYDEAAAYAFVIDLRSLASGVLTTGADQ